MVSCDLCLFQLPVPVFLPTTLHGAEQIVETISQLTRKESPEQPPPTETVTEDKKPGMLTGGFSRCSSYHFIYIFFSSQIAKSRSCRNVQDILYLWSGSCVICDTLTQFPFYPYFQLLSVCLRCRCEASEGGEGRNRERILQD